MTDQQSFEATRPVSADPAVALAEALGQLPKETVKPALKAPAARPHIVAKTSVADLAEELGLKLGDQNGLTIRRIKRGKGYSFHRANGTQIRHVGIIRRLHSMAGQLEQHSFFFFCCGSARPTEIFFGILPELISL